MCAPVLKMWVEGTLEKENPELYREILEVMAEELDRRVNAAMLALADDTVDAETAKAALDAAIDARASGIIPLHWDPYIQIVSVTEATAAEFTGAIQLELETNDLLRSDWGRLIAPRQAEADWVSLTDVRVRAFGMMSAVRGGKHRQYRPTLAILDDPDSEETVGTTRLRDKQQGKVVAGLAFGLEPMVGRLFMVGTPLHPDCLVCRFTKPDFDSRWLKLRFAAIQEDGTPLWPERWTIEALQEEEDAAPEAFAMEMMDTPPSAGKPFETIHYYDREEWRDVDLPKILAFDPALGRTEKADYQAIVVLRGPTPAGELLVHRCELLRIGDPKVLMERVNQIRKEEQPDMAIMETIGFQAVLVTLSSMLAEGGSALLADWLRIDSQVQGKDLRIRGMAPASNSGKIRFPSDKSCRNLECQALDYPDGKKDGLDVMEM
ncbi:MAG TPA: hypothetical protein PKW90_21520, partial [Myxococcota bacterium]|nr:hypothetical protein [Myxococcota bacterium]